MDDGVDAPVTLWLCDSRSSTPEDERYWQLHRRHIDQFLGSDSLTESLSP